MMVTSTQAVEAPLAERDHVARDGGATEADDLGGLLPRRPAVE
jgi:hypothetical protein